MATTQQLEYLVKVNDRDLRDLQKSVKETNSALGDDVSKASSKGSTALSKLGKVAKVGAGAALAGLGLAAKLGFDEIREGQQVSAQTAAVLKSTGGAAKVTQGQIEDLAGSISRKTGIDDEAIQAGQNMLLTFTNIRNEAGKGNDIFNQSTSILTDMSVAMGTDVKSGAIQLGKALNDPVKGVSALSRVGVTFTAQQKKVIARLVETGDTAGAQKIILAELNKEFGGSAEAAGNTLPGQMAKAKNAFAGLTGELMMSLLPAFNSIIGAMASVAEWMSEHQTITKVLIGVLGGLAVFVLIAGWIKSVVTAFAALNAVMAANPIGLVILALAALVAGLVIAYQKSETFRNIVNGALNAVKKVGTEVADFFRVDIPNAFNRVINWVREHWPAIVTLLSGPFAPLVLAATGAFGIRAKVIDGLNDVKDFFKGLPGWFGDKARDIADAIVNGLRGLGGAVKGVAVDLGSQLINGIIDVINSMTQGINDAIPNKISIPAAPDINLPDNPIPRIGHRALGGPVQGRHPYIVGERGPELFVPGSSGSVIPNGAFGGALVQIEHMEVRDEIDPERIAAALSLRLGLAR